MSTVADLASVAARIDDLRKRPERRDELVALLGETAPIYAGRSATDAERLRGYVLASFADGPSADGILTYLLEQIESGHDPFAVAAAAKALRNVMAVPDSAALSLIEAIRRLSAGDAYVWHDELTTLRSRPPDRTMLMELAQSLAQILPRAGASGPAAVDLLREVLDQGTFHPRVRVILEAALSAAASDGEPAANCCRGTQTAPAIRSLEPRDRDVAPPLDIEMQDQDGATVRFGDLLAGHVSAVAFFYTRCENPEKCSLTITKLARLQRLVTSDPSLHDARLAAITYDPAFDTPERLKAYGRDRGISFDQRTRLLRTVDALAPLARFFDLGVSYGQSTVNLHRIELALLDRDMRLVDRVQRRQWHPDEIVQRLAALVAAER